MGRSPELTAMCIDEMILHPLKQDKDGETGIGEGTWWDVACVMDMDETKTRRLFQTLATQYSYTRAQVAWIKRKLVSAMKGCEDHIREHPTLDHQKGQTTIDIIDAAFEEWSRCFTDVPLTAEQMARHIPSAQRAPVNIQLCDAIVAKEHKRSYRFVFDSTIDDSGSSSDDSDSSSDDSDSE